MKATVTYECTERGHEQKLVITASGDFDTPGSTRELEMVFEPALSYDTSDPSGLLAVTVEVFRLLCEREGVA